MLARSGSAARAGVELAIGIVDTPVAIGRRGDTVFAIGTSRAMYAGVGDAWRGAGGERRLEE